MRLLAAAAVSSLAASAVAGAARPPVALISSPAHVALAGSAKSPLSVTNSGADPVVVDVARAGFSLDLRGDRAWRRGPPPGSRLPRDGWRWLRARAPR